jgi:hypothetical protein
VQLPVGPLNSTVPWSNGYDTWFTSGKRWFDSIRDYSIAPRYANGGAVRLKPGCLQVRLLLWVLTRKNGSVGNWQTPSA